MNLHTDKFAGAEKVTNVQCRPQNINVLTVYL